MQWFEALLLGVIQGLTEFLPVSSSGHLEIGQAILHTTSSDNLTFAIVVHVATVLSTICVFYQQIWQLLKGTFSTTQWNTEKDYVAKLLVSMIPVFIVGMFFKDYVESFFGSGLLIVGICLLITALLLALSEYITKKNNNQGHPVTYRDSIIIGLAQAVAVLPGLSRSGATIATGLLCGVKKETIAQFSFLMVLIPILGEALLDAIKIIKDPSLFTSIPLSSLAIGFISAFLVGLLACKFMIHIVQKQKLTYFAIYCLIVGIVAIIYSTL
ncbi:MAG: undecaprenyl-diphosphate phosphatase [Paludibacteraceae bacterium]|nr:undecaprenyl-diphosphate phosphatase [Paludibacteraceae bacterium]